MFLLIEVFMKNILLCLFLFSTNSLMAAQPFLLGTGYNSQEGKLTGRCVIPAQPHLLLKGGTTESNFSIDTNLDREKLSILLNAGLEGEVSLAEIKASAQGEFIFGSESNDFRLNQVFSWKITGPSIGFIPQIMNDNTCGVSDGLRSMLETTNTSREIKTDTAIGYRDCQTPKLNAASSGDDYKNFKASCGDSYINQVNLGASLFVSLNLDFKDSALKTSFAGNGSLKLTDLFEGKAEFKTKYENFKDKISITINAIQLGGNPQNLSRIFTGTNSPRKDESIETSDFHILKCAFNDEGLKKCKLALSAIIAYAKDDFSPSLRNMNYDERSHSGPTVVSYTTRSYKNGGFSNLMSKDSGFVETKFANIKKEIIAKGIENNSALELTNKIMQLDSLSSLERQRVHFESAKIEHNLTLLKNLDTQCFYGEKSICIKEFETYIEKGVVSVENQNMAQDPNDFTGYMALNKDNLKIAEDFLNLCKLYPSSKEKIGIFSTVARIAIANDFFNEIISEEKLGPNASNSFKIDTNQCETLFNRISQDSTLDLSFYTCKDKVKISDNKLPPEACKTFKVTDLRPIKGLNFIKTLRLEGNGIVDISPIEHLSDNLENLNLNQNNISNIQTLSTLNKIKNLDLSSNKIYSLKEIADTISLIKGTHNFKMVRLDSTSYSEYADDKNHNTDQKFQCMIRYTDAHITYSSDTTPICNGENRSGKDISSIIVTEPELKSYCRDRVQKCVKQCPISNAKCTEDQKIFVRVF